MKSNFIFIILFILTKITPLYSNELNDSIKVNNSIYLDKIIIFGNDKTKNEVILRELETKENSILDTNLIKSDIQRLYNLALFNKVEFLFVNSNRKRVNLIIQVEESFNFLPLPQGGIKEGDFKKIWGGFNFVWRNFRGLNETINLSFGIGYEPFISFAYTNPWIFGKNHYFLSYNLGYSRNYGRNSLDNDTIGYIFNKNELPTFNIDNFNTGIRLGKYITKRINILASLAYNSVYTGEYQEGRTINSSGKDKYFSIGASINYDSRDIARYTLSGALIDFRISHSGLFNSSININKFNSDIRTFIPIKLSENYQITLASKLKSTISFGQGYIPSYMKESFGYGDLIRGWDNFVMEGESKLGFSAEVRIPVIKVFYVKGKDHFIIKRFKIFRDFSYRYGLFLTTFFDSGTVWDREDKLLSLKFIKGFGFGLNFLLPFDFIGRLDTGFKYQNSKFKGQIVISLDSSF